MLRENREPFRMQGALPGGRVARTFSGAKASTFVDKINADTATALYIGISEVFLY